MFPDDLFVINSAAGVMYQLENDNIKSTTKVVKEARAVLIAQNQKDIYTVNRDDNSITRYDISTKTVLGDITVGKMPYGICEDPNGVIYVTNYAENTVSVIENNLANKNKILVGRGPKGIVSDSNGNIWVACYLDNTVIKIVNRTVVQTIPMAGNPEGITCDMANNIWVACSTSNVAVKIVKSRKQLTVPVGKRPLTLVPDSKGNVFVANFEDDTVTIITASNDEQNITVSVGDGPTAIDVDSKDNVYVVSNLSGEDIVKISPDNFVVINHIPVTYDMNAFGDFTGCMAYNVFHPRRVANNGIQNNANNFFDALYPTYKFSNMEEHEDTVDFSVDSDLLDLTKFKVLKLNGQTMTETSITMDWSDVGNMVYLTASFKENGTNPITFKPIYIKNIFNTKYYIVNPEFDKITFLYNKVVDFNIHDIVTSVVCTNTIGHIVVLIPNRIFAIAKNYLTVGNGYNFGNTWLEEPDDANVPLIKALLTPEEGEVYQVLYNPVVSEDNELFFFHFYKIMSAY